MSPDVRKEGVMFANAFSRASLASVIQSTTKMLHTLRVVQNHRRGARLAVLVLAMVLLAATQISHAVLSVQPSKNDVVIFHFSTQ